MKKRQLRTVSVTAQERPGELSQRTPKRDSAKESLSRSYIGIHAVTKTHSVLTTTLQKFQLSAKLRFLKILRIIPFHGNSLTKYEPEAHEFFMESYHSDYAITKIDHARSNSRHYLKRIRRRC